VVAAGVCWRRKPAHCLEGAIFAAAATARQMDTLPLLLDFRKPKHDTDHVIAHLPPKKRGAGGAVAKSKLHRIAGWREPIHRNACAKLALTYFNTYVNLRRERSTLRRFFRCR